MPCKPVPLDAAEPATNGNGKHEPLPLLLTKAQAAKLCGLGLSTWDRYCCSKWVPQPLRVGTTIRWRLSDISEWIEAGCPRG